MGLSAGNITGIAYRPDVMIQVGCRFYEHVAVRILHSACSVCSLR